MNWISDKQELVKKQYSNDSNLQKRIQIHQYSINKQGWVDFLLSHIQINEGDNILDIGCGNAELWKNRFEHQTDFNSLVLTDISDGMLSKAKDNLSIYDSKYKIEYKIVDASLIPFSDNSFDIVVANHVLYHVLNVNTAIQEIYRVLKPNGRFYASTVGKRHMLEMSNIVNDCFPSLAYSSSSVADRFGLENGTCIIDKYFSDANCIVYDDYLLVPNIDPIVEYIISLDNDGLLGNPDNLTALRNSIKQKYDFSNGFRITKASGIITGKKKD